MSERSSNLFAQSEPPTLDHMIGQRRVVERLKVAMEASIADGKRLPHMLFTGPPGVGKTMMASLLAREMGSPMHSAVGTSLCFCAQMNGFLMAPQDKEVAFIDEGHLLDSWGQHSLLRALEDGRIYLNRNPGGKPVEVEIGDATILMATTDEYQLLKPLRDRFRMVLRFDYYSDQELVELVRQRIIRLGWHVDQEAIEPIAQRGLGIPRISLRLLESVRRTARAEGTERITLAHVQRTCELEGLDILGLGPLERQYLSVLRWAEGPTRLNVLASALGVPSATISQVIEPTLIRLGLLLKDNNGRYLTNQAVIHFDATEPQGGLRVP